MLIGNLEKDGQGGAGTQRARFPCRRVPDANLYLRDGAVLFLGTGKGKVCSLIQITYISWKFPYEKEYNERG